MDIENYSLKKCFKCEEIKSLSDFYRHTKMADGRVNKCKECNKKDVRTNRRSNLDKYRAYDRQRGNRQENKYHRDYRKKYPQKVRARRKVAYEISLGNIKSKPCEKCGYKGVTHAHHDDYHYPLNIRWLCPACHREWHDQNGEAPNG